MSYDHRLVLTISYIWITTLATLFMDRRKFIPSDNLAEFKDSDMLLVAGMSRDVIDANTPAGVITGMSWLQLLPYIVVTYQGKYLTYSRAKSAETRLSANRSIGFGGHMDLKPEDLKENDTVKFLSSANDLRKFIHTEAQRELLEELGIHVDNLVFSNFISDYTNTVGSVHLGMLAMVELTDEQYSSIQAAPTEIVDLRWEDINALYVDVYSYENWSQMIIEKEFNTHGIL